MKIRVFVIVLFILLLVIVNCNNDEKIVIRLPWLHQAQYAGIYVAKEKGFFEDKGLSNVEILPGGPNIRPMDLVSSGSEQFSITGSTPFFNAAKENREIKILATLDQKHAFCYFARKDMNINSPLDFKGKRVGHKVMHENNLVALLISVGLTKNDVELISIPPGMSLFFIEDPDKMVPIWPGHAADEPLLAEEKGIEVNYFFPEDYDKKTRIGNLLFTSIEYEKQNPETVSKIVSAIIEGWYYAFNNVNEAVNITMKYVKGNEEDKKHQKNMLLKMKEFMLIKKFGNKIGWCDVDRWKQALDYYKNSNPDAAKLLLDDILTNEYVENYYNSK